ncbi:SIS domain-containing protein [Streptomyces sp. B1866]|uniref:SIS domain-containing protein n=1 Tax=Streptomyces sp. B1866 TaxID=3075431 RepID=UPI00289191C2|nr:SIS domain-containing protein [Streptomyces sp. B1866]MDT3398888.1 SIS domain-containing protein [Streptomyces sp. B1866]
MLDESLLDAPDALARADVRGLLRGAAESGARVRTAARHAAEAGIGDLTPDGRPRAVLVAAPGPAGACIVDLLDALGGSGSPVTLISPTGVAAAPGALRWTLPGWAGPLDLLLVATPDGAEPGLPLLVEQAYRHGCSLVAVAPAGSPLTGAVTQARGLTVPVAADRSGPYDAGSGPADPHGPGAGDPHGAYAAARPADGQDPAAHPGTLWSLLTPLLALADRIGLVSAPPAALLRVADRLDRVAERCGPAVATYGNPAKALATELAEALTLVWTEGPVAAAAGRRFAGLLRGLAGRPALAAELPEALAAHAALLTGAFGGTADPDDFFRDRVEEPEALRARIVLVRDEPSTALSALPAARELALARDTAVSELEPDGGSALDTAADLLATADFAAVYLALARADGR